MREPLLVKALLFLLSVLVVVEGNTTRCPHTTATRETKPLYLLTLVPFPDPRDGVGWDRGLGTVPGARVARDEINNHTDLLPGYHIELIEENIEACSLTETGTGLINLVKYTVSPPCHPVVAVIGLMCSSHTSILSPVAGHDGFNLIQLAAANSPIFRTKNKSFPHLWRVLGAGTVYADTTLALMDRFGWRRIGIIYDLDSAYFTHVATYFQSQVQVTPDKEVIYTASILRHNIPTDQIVSNIRSQAVRVLFVALNDLQAAELLCQFQAKGLTYPDYIWIQIGKRLDLIRQEKKCDDKILVKAKQGHIQLQIQSIPSNESTILVSGEDYSSYVHKYIENLKQVEEEYNTSILPDLVYSNLLYDQVWAFALAMNNSLPVLENRNLSLDNYTIGQLEITKVIEEQMAKLNFQGASGNIKFNDKHGVFATVDIYQVNGSDEMFIGSYVPQLESEQVSYNLSLSIDNSSLPDDEPPEEYVMIPLPISAVLYSFAGLIIIFTTVVLILLLYFREWPEVKATSPYISIIMLIGCFFFCFAAIFRTTYGTFIFNGNIIAYRVLVSADNFCMSSGLSMVIITIFFKLLRVHHFFSYMTLKLRKMWRTCSLFALILALSLWISMGYLIVEILVPVYPTYYDRNETVSNILIVVKELVYPADQHLPGIICFIAVLLYNVVFLSFIVYFAIRTRKIEQQQFKDTKKVNIFVAFLVVILALEILIAVAFLLGNLYWRANVTTSCFQLLLALCVPVVFFLPKLVPSMFKPKPIIRRNSARRSSSRASLRRTFSPPQYSNSLRISGK